MQFNSKRCHIVTTGFAQWVSRMWDASCRAIHRAAGVALIYDLVYYPI